MPALAPPQRHQLLLAHHLAAGGNRPHLGSSIVGADKDWGSQSLLDPHSSPGPTHLPHNLGTNNEQASSYSLALRALERQDPKAKL